MHAVTGSDLHKAEVCARWGCMHFISVVLWYVIFFFFGVRKLLRLHTWQSIPLDIDNSYFSVDLCSNNRLAMMQVKFSFLKRNYFPKVSELGTFVVQRNQSFGSVVFPFIPICLGLWLKLVIQMSKQSPLDPRPKQA